MQFPTINLEDQVREIGQRPIGALVWGAYLLGKGVKVTIQVELSERDCELIEKIWRGAP
ncbi:MAG TPA: hypothetical protein PKY30_06585 [Myxococcota bacterium]|nr:hypothetical protein [Myxococcota bacterium]HND31342.1 hypothetical protein [Myxococcota bacterium]HNH46685.1 hypothetical protein [Myxococcota bacterium]